MKHSNNNKTSEKNVLGAFFKLGNFSYPFKIIGKSEILESAEFSFPTKLTICIPLFLAVSAISNILALSPEFYITINKTSSL